MYQDSLVEVNAESLIINHYYFPGIGKTIPLEDIAEVRVYNPSLFTGQWRIWGMGLRPVWFAMDWKRPVRDAIFIVEINDSEMRAGFTAESSEGVLCALRDRKVPVEYETE
jgi:hypothetical protein